VQLQKDIRPIVVMELKSNMNNIKTYFLMSLSLLGAFLISQYLVQKVFLYSSPKTNPQYIAQMQLDLLTTKSKISGLFRPSVKKINTYTATIPEKLFKAVSPGVKAYHKSDNEVYLKLEQDIKYTSEHLKMKDGSFVNVIDLTGEN